jgi:hypothetical protein
LPYRRQACRQRSYVLLIASKEQELYGLSAALSNRQKRERKKEKKKEDTLR